MMKSYRRCLFILAYHENTPDFRHYENIYYGRILGYAGN